MRLHNIGLFAVTFSLVALNNCAAPEPESFEGTGDTSSNQVSAGRQKVAEGKNGSSTTTSSSSSSGSTATTTTTSSSSSSGSSAVTTSSSSSGGSTTSSSSSGGVDWIGAIGSLINAGSQASQSSSSSGSSNNGSSGGTGGSFPVLVTWNGVDGTEASLDVVLKGGHIIGPCIAVDILRDDFNSGRSDGLGYSFDGNCRSNSEQPTADNLDKFRVCSARNGDWANATCTESAPWDHRSNNVHIDNH